MIFQSTENYLSIFPIGLLCAVNRPVRTKLMLILVECSLFKSWNEHR